METILEMHRDGGAYMLNISGINLLALGFLIAVVVCVSLKKEWKWFGFGLLFCAVSVLALGGWAYHIGMTAAMSAIASADPEIKSLLIEESRIYAIIPFKYGAASAVFWVIAGTTTVFYSKCA